jgi:energy-coupling factor transporter transmembrane protein EcfT
MELKEGDHKVSSIDTKSKIILTLIFIIVSILVISYEQILLISILAIFLIILFRVNIFSVLKKSLIPLPLVISLSLISFFSDVRDTKLRFSNVSIEYTDLEITAFFFIRSMIIVIISISLVESEESFFEIIYGLDELGMPKALVSILLLMYRSTLDLMIEAKRMIDVRYSRSTYRMWGTNLYTYRIIGYMIAASLVRGFIKRGLRRDSLYSRNFKGTLYHKSKPFRFNGLLLLWISTISLILILLSTNLEFTDIGRRI